MVETEVDVTRVTTALYNLLKPLPSEDRSRVVKAAQMLLGEVPNSAAEQSSKSGVPTMDNEEIHGGFAPRARGWLLKNDLSEEGISQVFHIEGESVEVIAGEIPGKNGREKTINAYLLTGAKNLIANGEAKFDDKSAREICKALGCYYETNHATYIKDKGNLIGGSKSAGWTLTAPGLKAVADLIKEIAAHEIGSR